MRISIDGEGSRGGLLLLMLSALLSGCYHAVPPAMLQSVGTGTAQWITSEEGQRFSASINPNALVPLIFKSGGIVESIRQVRGADGRMRDIGVGDPVDVGMMLARVRTTEYNAKVQQAEGGLEQAEAQLSAARADQVQATLTYNRAKNLFEAASLIKPDFDRAQAGYDSARAQVQQATAAIASAQAALLQAKVAYEDTTLRAPFRGFLTERQIDVGSLVGSSSPAFTVIDTHVVKASFAVPDVSLKSVHLGQRLDISLDTVPGPIAGIVTAISPAADPRSRVFSVDVTMANPKNTIRPGMIGSLILGSGEGQQAHLVVPLGAIIKSPEHENGFAVFLIQENAGKTYVKAQDVQLGKAFGDAMEVRSGLARGQRIVVLGSQSIRDGQQVRVLR